MFVGMKLLLNFIFGAFIVATFINLLWRHKNYVQRDVHYENHEEIFKYVSTLKG